MVELKNRSGGGTFYVNASLVEAIFEREGDTSEIVLTTGSRYTSIESKDAVSKKVNIALLLLNGMEEE